MLPKDIDALKGTYCPLWQKECHKVCPTCRWFKHVRGRNPNTGEDIDNYDCSISWMPIMQIETTQAARSGAAATESFRNEFVESNQTGRILPIGAIDAYQQLSASFPPQKLLGTSE